MAESLYEIYELLAVKNDYLVQDVYHMIEAYNPRNKKRTSLFDHIKKCVASDTNDQQLYNQETESEGGKKTIIKFRFSLLQKITCIGKKLIFFFLLRKIECCTKQTL